MAKEQPNGTKRMYAVLLIAVALSTLAGRGCDYITAKADQTNTVRNVEAKIETLKTDGCDKSRTNSYNMVRIETQLAAVKETLDTIKEDNHDILKALSVSP